MKFDVIRNEIETYFDKKLSGAKISDGLEQDIWDKIEALIEDMEDSVRSTERNIDNEIENFNWEEEKANIIDDIRTQDYLERSLFA